MKYKHKIVIIADNVDSYATVIKACQNSKGVTILDGGMVNDEAESSDKSKRIVKKPFTRKANAASMLLEHAAKNWTGKTFTREDVSKFLEGTGLYAGNSASPLTSQLQAKGKIIKIAEKTFKLA